MLLNPISHLEIDSRITNITSERIGTDNASFIIHKLFLPNRISVELSIWIYGFVETLSRFINMFFSMNECFRSAWKHVCLLILCLRSQFSSCIRANNRFIVFVLITHSFTLEWVFFAWFTRSCIHDMVYNDFFLQKRMHNLSFIPGSRKKMRFSKMSSNSINSLENPKNQNRFHLTY